MVAGGMENMTRAPFLLEKARQGYRLGHGELTDSLIKDGLWDVYNQFHMGNAGELCAAKYRFSRQDVDDFALESYGRAREAIASGAFKREIVPVEVSQRKSAPVIVTADEEPNRVESGEASRPQAGLSGRWGLDGGELTFLQRRRGGYDRHGRRGSHCRPRRPPRRSAPAGVSPDRAAPRRARARGGSARASGVMPTARSASW